MPSTPSEADRAAGWLADMRDHIEMAADFTSGMSREAFQGDLRTVYAVIRCLEVISEASRRLAPELKGRHPHIAWRDMAAAGNYFRHEYRGVDPIKVWDTLERALPPLRSVVEQEIGPAAAHGATDG